MVKLVLGKLAIGSGLFENSTDDCLQRLENPSEGMGKS